MISFFISVISALLLGVLSTRLVMKRKLQELELTVKYEREFSRSLTSKISYASQRINTLERYRNQLLSTVNSVYYNPETDAIIALDKLEKLGEI